MDSADSDPEPGVIPNCKDHGFPWSFFARKGVETIRRLLFSLLYGTVFLYKAEGRDTMDAEIFGAFIQQRRKALGMSQAELAEKLHVTAKAVSRWERGVGFPSIELLQPLADALEITIVELMQSRMLEAELSKEEASEIITESIESIRTQERKQRRKIYSLFFLLPIVFAAQFFMLLVYYDFKDSFDSRWASVLFYEIIFLTGILGSRAVYYIIENEYSKLKDKASIQKGMVRCIIIAISAFFFVICFGLWRIGETVTAIFAAVFAVALLTAIYFYFFFGKNKEK